MSEPEAFTALFPIHNRINYVGGIESLTIDGIRYYFGYSNSNDIVLSPLISDMDTMAAFASNFMLQQHGLRRERHEPAYWRELVEDSIDNSDLWSREGSRDFTTEYLRRIVFELRQAQITGTQPQGLFIETNLFDWLSSACEDTVDPSEDESVAMALSRLRIDAETLAAADCAYEAVAILDESQELPPGGSYADVAWVILAYLRCYVLSAPNNWNVLFSPLLSN